MSDHADVIRALLLDMGNGDTSPEEYDAGLAALDALVAEKATAIDIMRAALGRAEAAEAERDCVGEWLQESESRVTELEAALGEMLALIQTRRTSLHMDGTEMFAQPVLAQLNSIAKAALAKEEVASDLSASV